MLTNYIKAAEALAAAHHCLGTTKYFQAATKKLFRSLYPRYSLL